MEIGSALVYDLPMQLSGRLLHIVVNEPGFFRCEHFRCSEFLWWIVTGKHLSEIPQRCAGQHLCTHQGVELVEGIPISEQFSVPSRKELVDEIKDDGRFANFDVENQPLPYQLRKEEKEGMEEAEDYDDDTKEQEPMKPENYHLDDLLVPGSPVGIFSASTHVAHHFAISVGHNLFIAKRGSGGLVLETAEEILSDYCEHAPDLLLCPFRYI